MTVAVAVLVSTPLAVILAGDRLTLTLEAPWVRDAVALTLGVGVCVGCGDRGQLRGAGGRDGRGVRTVAVVGDRRDLLVWYVDVKDRCSPASGTPASETVAVAVLVDMPSGAIVSGLSDSLMIGAAQALVVQNGAVFTEPTVRAPVPAGLGPSAAPHQLSVVLTVTPP